MDKQLLIAGIDPGTTLGFAFIDLHGDIIKTDSSKDWDMNKLISESIKHGKIIIVSCDKKRIPDFVESFAKKLGAKIIKPKEDLKIKHKKELVKTFKAKNDHQRDALASALLALKNLKPLIKKLDLFIERNKKEKITNQLKELVIKEGISIKPAADLIEEKDVQITKIIKDSIEEKPLSKKSLFSLYTKCHDALETNKQLEKKTRILGSKLNTLRKENENFQRVIEHRRFDKKSEEILKNKERNIEQFKKTLEEEHSKISRLKENINTLYGFLNKKDNVVIKRLPDLNFNTFKEYNKIININQDDILLVDNPNIISDKTISQLKDKINIMIYSKEPLKKLKPQLPFIFIDSKKLDIEKEKYFTVVKKDQFEDAKNNAQMLNKLLDDYKKERSRLPE